AWRARADRRSGGRRGEVEELDLERLLARECAEQPVRAAVPVMRSDETVARPEQLECDRDRCHACRRDNASGAVLELRNRAGEDIARRVARPGVVVVPL